MATVQFLPETLRPFLKLSKDKNYFILDEWDKWFSMDPFEHAKVFITASGNVRFTSRIEEVHFTRSGIPSLLLESFVPEPEKKFFKQQPTVLVRTGFVCGGYAIMSSFQANAAREFNYNNSSVVEIANVFYPKVTLSPYLLKLPIRHDFILRYEIEGEKSKVKPDSISIDQIVVPNAIDSELAISHPELVEAVLYIGEDVEVPLIIEQVLSSETEGTFLYKSKVQTGYEKIAEHIDIQWEQKSRNIAKRERDAKKRELEIISGKYMQTLNKTHFFYLGENSKWDHELEKLGNLRTIPDLDIEYILKEMLEDRCDIIVADADLWRELSIDLTKAIKDVKELAKTPLFWIGERQNPYFGAKRFQLLNIGAFDFFSSDINMPFFSQKIDWALHNRELGEGEPLVIISPDNQQLYKLGFALQKRGIKIIKSTSKDNPLVELKEHEPKWIIIDGGGIGKGFDVILEACLNWNKRRKNKVDIFLLANYVHPNRALGWIESGLTDILIRSDSIDKIVKRVHERINETRVAEE